MSNSKITERAIQDAFLAELNDRPLSKISVKDISDRCGINRNTFYYHYDDVPDLLEKLCQGEFDNIVAQYPSFSSVEECLGAAMRLASEHKKAIHHIYYSASRETYISSLWRICDYVISKYADSAFPDIPISDKDRELFIRYHKCACFGLIVDWIASGMDDSYAEGISRIFELKKGSEELIIKNAIASY